MMVLRMLIFLDSIGNDFKYLNISVLTTKVSTITQRPSPKLFDRETRPKK